MPEDLSFEQVMRDLGEIPVVRIALIAFGAWALAFAASWLLERGAERLPAAWRVRLLAWAPVVRLAIIVVAVVWIVPLVISPTAENLFALLGALGIALGFAFKDFVSSLVAGVVAVFERPYRQGDWVRIKDAYGEVRGIGARAFEMVTPADDVVSVPHDLLWSEPVYNANDGERTLMVVTRLFLHPDHDGAWLRERLFEVIWTSAYLDPTRPMHVHVVEEAWGTRFEMKAYPLEARDQFAFRSDLTLRAKAVVRAAGFEFATTPAVGEGTVPPGA